MRNMPTKIRIEARIILRVIISPRKTPKIVAKKMRVADRGAERLAPILLIAKYKHILAKKELKNSSNRHIKYKSPLYSRIQDGGRK
jgi:hypothetical protein